MGTTPEASSPSTVPTTATNADNSVTTTSFTVNGTDVAPTVAADNSSVSAAEGAAMGNTGAFADGDDARGVKSVHRAHHRHQRRQLGHDHLLHRQRYRRGPDRGRRQLLGERCGRRGDGQHRRLRGWGRRPRRQVRPPCPPPPPTPTTRSRPPPSPSTVPTWPRPWPPTTPR